MDELIRRKDALQAIAQLPLPYGVQRDKIIATIYEVPATKALPVSHELWQHMDKILRGNLVPVVRCKDCKYVYRDEESGCYFCGEQHINPEHFCARGERRNTHE